MALLGTVNIELWAVLLGAKDSLLGIQLPFEYEVKRLKLKETPLKDEIINANGKLDVKYMASNLSCSDNPEFIFLYKTECRTMPIEYFTLSEMLGGTKKASLFFDELTENWNVDIFRILSMLRLVQEGNIEVADRFYKLHGNYGANNINDKIVSSQDMPISVYEDLYDWNIANEDTFQKIITLPDSFLKGLDGVTVLQDLMMHIKTL